MNVVSVMVIISTCSGCTNTNACNYDTNAIIDDGSCEFSTYPYNCNGDCLNDSDSDDVCDELEIYGCTDSSASNYNPDATEDDGSCQEECDPILYLEELNIYDFEFNGSISATVLINGQQNGSEEDILVGYVDGDIRGYITGLFFPPTGEMVFSLMLYSNIVSGEMVSFKYYHAASNQVFCLDETLEFTSDMFIGNALDPFTFNIQEEYNLGCTDIDACNYNSQANFDDGSCEYSLEYYDCNNNCLNDFDTDGICDELDLCEGLSNMDTDGDGICNDIDPCIGYDNENDDDDDGVCNDYDPCIGSSNIDTDGDGICNDQEVEGCNDPNACNYDPDATDEGECIYVEEFYDCDGSCIAEIDCSGECGGDSFIDDCGECVSGDTPSDDCLGIQIPQNFYLNQNYPNPFNPFTSIEYGTPNPDNIKIILYDVIGRKINILIDKFHQPGYYELTLSSEKLNSGIYILRLISSKKVLTRKIAVVK